MVCITQFTAQFEALTVLAFNLATRQHSTYRSAGEFNGLFIPIPHSFAATLFSLPNYSMSIPIPIGSHEKMARETRILIFDEDIYL